MFDLIFAIICSSIISIVMRLSKNKVNNKMMMFASNYLVCFICSLFFVNSFSNLGFSKSSFAIWFGAVSGICYLVSFLFLEFNIRNNGVVLTSIFSKLGLLVPLFISFVFFNEVLGKLKIIGIVIALLAIVLMNIDISKLKKNNDNGTIKDKEEDNLKKHNMMKILLVCVLLFSGITDATSSIFEHNENIMFKGVYLMVLFFVAFLASLTVLFIKRETMNLKDGIYGVIIGIPNYFSSFFLLNALTKINASIVYPTYSVATIVLVTLSGVFMFKEKLKITDIIGIVMIIGALILLNI